MITRRKFATGLFAGICAPAIIRTPGLLMPVKRVVLAPALRLVGPEDHKPIGCVVPMIDRDIPDGWMPCDGRSVSARMYPEFAALGTNFGDENGNPMVPDYRSIRGLTGGRSTGGNDFGINYYIKVGGAVIPQNFTEHRDRRHRYIYGS